MKYRHGIYVDRHQGFAKLINRGDEQNYPTYLENDTISSREVAQGHAHKSTEKEFVTRWAPKIPSENITLDKTRKSNYKGSRFPGNTNNTENMAGGDGMQVSGSSSISKCADHRGGPSHYHDIVVQLEPKRGKNQVRFKKRDCVKRIQSKEFNNMKPVKQSGARLTNVRGIGKIFLSDANFVKRCSVCWRDGSRQRWRCSSQTHAIFVE